MKKRTTIDDVAQAAGVSRQTVSRAINNMGGISETTRSRVLQTVDALGYRPSRLAQGMASNHSRTIGLVIGNIANPAHADVVRGLQDVAQTNGYDVFLRNTDHEAAEELEALQSLIAENVDGIVLLGSELSDGTLASLADRTMPIVVIFRSIVAPNIASIVTDVERATRSVVDYLFGTGHKAIGLLARPGNSDEMRQVQGFRAAVEAHGICLPDGWIEQAEPTPEGGYHGTHRLIRLNNELTAIVAFNDLMAIGAIKACFDLGRPVPDSVSVFGYGDIALSAFTLPPLSTIRIHSYHVGNRAMEQLLALLTHPEPNTIQTSLDIELVIRGSTSEL